MAIEPAALHEALLEAASAVSGGRIEALLRASPDRAERYRCDAAGLTLDFSKHLLDDDSWQLLLELERPLPGGHVRSLMGLPVRTLQGR